MEIKINTLDLSSEAPPVAKAAASIGEDVKKQSECEPDPIETYKTIGVNKQIKNGCPG
jgi:hypothetical protein